MGTKASIALSCAHLNFQTCKKTSLQSSCSTRRTELFSYEQSIFYTIIAAVIALPRTELKAKVVDAPEVLHSKSPPAADMLDSLATGSPRLS